MNDPKPKLTELLEGLAVLPEADVLTFLNKMCAARSIQIPTANPTLSDILQAIEKHLDAHRCRPIIEFGGGEAEWSLIVNDLIGLQSAVKKIISRKSPAESASGCERDPQSQSLAGERACGRPPGEGRSTPERSPDDPRVTGGRDADDPRATPGEQLDDPSPSRSKSKSRHETEEQLKRERAEYLAQLLRERTSRSPIDDIPSEQQRILFDLLEENPATIVAEMIAQPEPLGWNFHISPSSLKRFRDRYRERLEKVRRIQTIAEAARTVEDLGLGNPKVIEAAQHLIKMRFLEAASDTEGSNHELQLISNILDRQRRTDLAERKQKLAEQAAETK